MKTIQALRAFLLLIAGVAAICPAFAQYTVTATPSQTGCFPGNIVCAPNDTSRGNTIKMAVTNVTGNTVSFSITKCSGSFNANGDAYLKTSVCNAASLASTTYLNGASSIPIQYAFPVGTHTVYGLTIGNGSRSHTPYFTITVSATCGTPNSANFTAATITSTGFTADWPAVTGATSYNVQLLDCSNNVLSTQSTTLTSKYFSGLSCGACYKFRVQAVCSGVLGGWSGYSSTVNTNSCGVPSSSGVSFSNVSSTALTATWPAVSNATSYDVGYTTCAGTYSGAMTNVSSPSITIPGLTPNTSYKIQIRANCGPVCQSVWSSSSACVTTTISPPAAPTLSAPANNACVSYSTLPTLSWSAVAGATNYRVYCYDITNGTVNAPALFPTQYPTTNSLTIPSGLGNWQPNHKYQWRVEAQNNGNTSAPSAWWEFKTKPTEAQATNSSPVLIGSTINFYSNNINAGNTYMWSGPASLAAITNPTLTNAQSSHAGTYTVTVSNSATGITCSYASITTVTFNAINITQPGSTSSYAVGQTMNLIWNSTGFQPTDMFQFELWSASTNSVQATLFPGMGTANSGGASWAIPNTIPTGMYYLKGYKVGCGTSCGVGNSATFNITNGTATPTVTVTLPLLNAPAACGLNLVFAWNTTNTPANAPMVIELVSPSPPYTVQYVVTPTPVANSSSPYTWSIPPNLTLANGAYKAKIYQQVSGSQPGYSATFNYSCAAPSAGVFVAYPNGGETLVKGSTYNISWAATGITGNVQIELTDANNVPLPAYTGFNPIGPALASAGSFAWTVPATLPLGQYKIKVYSLNNTTYNDLSNATFSVVAPTSGITVVYPNGGPTQSFAQGGNMAIQWNGSGFTGNVAIEYTDTFGNSPVLIATNVTSNATSNVYNWTIPPGLTPGWYKIKIYALANTSIQDKSDKGFQIASSAYTFSCAQWDAYPSSLSLEAKQAFDYLCNKGIIETQQLNASINNRLRREEAAKITFRSLYTPNINAPTPADFFPNPFIDLQQGAANYVREAKVMSYLEFADGRPVFNRAFTHFRPADSLQKQHYMKALLETFNIQPGTYTNNPWPAGTFIDVSPSLEMYHYICWAYANGILVAQTNFNPTQGVKRQEAIVLLYKLWNKIDLNQIVKPTPVAADFFSPFNQSPITGPLLQGIEDGVFNSYTKTSFGIAGKMPLTFAHSYNSAATQLEKYRAFEPMSEGWNHNYNCYIRRVDNGYGHDKRTILFWGDGTFNVWIDTAADWESKGIYSTLTTASGGNTYLYKTKSQITYEFEKVAGTKLWCLKKIKDRNNNSITLTWSAFPSSNNPAEDSLRAKLVQVADPQSRTLTFSYNSACKLTGVACNVPSTRQVVFTYNAAGDLSQYTEPKNQTTTYGYGNPGDPYTAHLLTTITLPKGNVITNFYDYQTRRVTSTAINGVNTMQVDPKQNYTSYSASDFTSSTITNTFGGQSTTTKITKNVLGAADTVQSATALVKMLYGNGQHPTKPTAITNYTNAVSVAPQYDAMGNVISITRTAPGVAAQTETFTYNAFNDITTHTNARGYADSFSYNSNGNLVGIKDALNNSTTILVNSDGTVQKVTNVATGLYTDYNYDAYGNTTATTLQGQITQTAEYDAASRLVKTTDPLAVQTVYSYDAVDQVQQVVADAGGLVNTVSYGYDANGNLTTVTNPKGGVTSLAYNSRDELTQYSFGGFTKKYAYYNDGRVDTFISQRGDVFKHLYNADGTLQSDGYASYTYHPGNKNLHTITHTGNGKVLTFSYDGFNRTTSVGYNDFGGNTVGYEYDANNNITKVTYPGGFAVQYIYDALDRLTQVKNFSSGASYATYTYLTDGRLSQCTNGNGTKTTYLYDALGRLDSIRNETSTGALICGYKFTLDAVGNHTAERASEPFAPPFPGIPSATVSYTHAANNRMTAQGATTFAYDGNGNNTGATGGLTTTATYDPRDNLLTNASPALSCEYDGIEARRKKNSTRYVLDVLGGANVLMETDLAGTPQAYYIHGLGLVCRLDAAQSNPAYYHYDYRGSTTAITNGSEVVTHRYSYGPFGEMHGAVESGFANAYRYVGKYGVQYEDSTLYFMRARYYNPMKGRFLGEDPVWGMNLFGYCHNNPVGFIDPTGLVEADLIKSSTDVVIMIFKYNKKGELTGADLRHGLVVVASLGADVADKVVKNLPPGANTAVFALELFVSDDKIITAQTIADGIEAVTKDVAGTIMPGYGGVVVEGGVNIVGAAFDRIWQWRANWYISRGQYGALTEHAKKRIQQIRDRERAAAQSQFAGHVHQATPAIVPPTPNLNSINSK